MTETYIKTQRKTKARTSRARVLSSNKRNEAKKKFLEQRAGEVEPISNKGMMKTLAPYLVGFALAAGGLVYASQNGNLDKFDSYVDKTVRKVSSLYR